MGDYEITALVMSEHEAFRRAFAGLDAADDPGAEWAGLADRLEVHAVAEEEIFYPLLAAEADDGVEDGLAAVREHNDIRAAVRAVADHDPGSESWWAAVQEAQRVNGDHMAEEEREFIPDFKDSVAAERREELGLDWLKLHDEHEGGRGLSGDDADPQAVVEAGDPSD